MAQESTEIPVSELQKNYDKIIAEQIYPNGIISLNEYEYFGSYKSCAGCLDAKCRKYKYQKRFRCTDNDDCECLNDIKDNKTIIVSCPEVLLGGECRNSKCLEDGSYKLSEKVSDGTICSKTLSIKDAAAKSTSVKKQKYSITTKIIDVTLKYKHLEDGSNKHKTSTVNSLVRKMCPVHRTSDKVSKKCECYLISDNCGNYIDKNGLINYNTKYIDQNNHVLIDKLIDDGCTGHIGEQINCRKPEIIDFTYAPK